MNILIVGDIVGRAGRDAFEELAGGLKTEWSLDAVIVNGENSAGGFGITSRIAKQLYRAGCDAITLGDHVWDQHDIIEYMKEEPRIVRPANFPTDTPGQGWTIVETKAGLKIGVINLLGRVFMRYNVDCPFRTLQKIVNEIKRETNIIVVDFHAETTSEKTAMGFFIDGQVSAVVGTHTHIQTADEKVLPKGTAYITDLGMTGPYDSVIGQNKDIILQRFLTSMPAKFQVAENDVVLHGVVVDVDDETGLARTISRIQKRSSRQN